MLTISPSCSFLVFFGILAAVAFVELGLRVAGLIISIRQEHLNLLSLKKEGDICILCVGESTTAGSMETSYPRSLEQTLNQLCPDKSFRVINKGTPGISTVEILSKFNQYLEDYQPDIVIVMNPIYKDEIHQLTQKLGFTAELVLAN